MIKKNSGLLVVADTSPLIAIAIMELFPVLDALFAKAYVPHAVVQECLQDLTKEKSKVIKKALKQNFIIEKAVRDTEYCQLLGEILDSGEAEAISLAKELGAIALIDEKAGRKVARRESIVCIGSLHILIKAKQTGRIKSAAPLLNRLIEHGYYLDNSLIKLVLDTCNE